MLPAEINSGPYTDGFTVRWVDKVKEGIVFWRGRIVLDGIRTFESESMQKTTPLDVFAKWAVRPAVHQVIHEYT